FRFDEQAGFGEHEAEILPVQGVHRRESHRALDQRQPFVAAARAHEADAEEMGRLRIVGGAGQRAAIDRNGLGEAAGLREPGCSLEIGAQDRHLVANTRPSASTANRSPALAASDQWMPIRLPPMPTVTPLNAHNPWADMANTPMTGRASRAARAAAPESAPWRGMTARRSPRRRAARARTDRTPRVRTSRSRDTRGTQARTPCGPAAAAGRGSRAPALRRGRPTHRQRTAC